MQITAKPAISVDEMKRDLPAFLHRLESGEPLVIVKAGKPLAEVKPLTSAHTKPRPYALCAGDFVVPDDFDAPLPKNIIAEFEGP